MKPAHTQIRIRIHKQLRDTVHGQLRDQVSIQVSNQIYDNLYEQVRGVQISFQTKQNILIWKQ
jgi:hypothetical protein